MTELAAVVATLEQRARWREAVRRELFDRQLQLYEDPSQFRAAHPGRRSGKSEFIPRAALLDALKAKSGQDIVIGAETQKKAKALHWHKLLRVAKRAGIPLQVDRSNGAIRTEWGATIYFWGISDQGAVDELRGFDILAAYFDEVATYAPLLKYLCDDVVFPALAGTGGSLTLCGTPSITRAGYWFEICQGSEKHNWSVHHWTMLQNKCFPRDAEVELEKARVRLGGDSASFQREWMGLFINDPGMQVYLYVPERNDVHCVAPAGYDRETWAHTIGVDFGMTNACAWVVVTSHPHEQKTYVLRAFKQVGLLTDQAAKITAEWCDAYRPHWLVGDAGGLGKPYVEEWNQRYAGLTKAGVKAASPLEYCMPVMLAAEKSEKRAAIEYINSELCAGSLLLCQDACDPYSQEMLTHPWADDTKQKEKPGSHNHCCDAALYAVKTHRAYLNEAAPGHKPARVHLKPDDPEYIELEREEIRRERADEWWDTPKGEGREWYE